MKASGPGRALHWLKIAYSQLRQWTALFNRTHQQ